MGRFSLQACIVVAALLLFLPAIHAGPSGFPVEVDLEALQEKSSTGGPVCVRLRIRNRTEEMLLLPRGVRVVDSLQEITNDPFPETLIVASLQTPDGHEAHASPEPLIGTSMVDPESFVLVPPGGQIKVVWNLTWWPWEFSFPEGGSYTLAVKLQFSLNTWLEYVEKDRPWLVSVDAVSLVSQHRNSLVEGTIVPDPLTIRICDPRSSTECLPPYEDKSQSAPHLICSCLEDNAEGLKE